jgi:hypothetical protein
LNQRTETPEEKAQRQMMLSSVLGQLDMLVAALAKDAPPPVLLSAQDFRKALKDWSDA